MSADEKPEGGRPQREATAAILSAALRFDAEEFKAVTMEAPRRASRNHGVSSLAEPGPLFSMVSNEIDARAGVPPRRVREVRR